jgi:serine/threonine-protein kinase
MFELLTGEAIFGTTEETTTILENVVVKDIPKPRDINPEIPEALEKIILKSLERNLSKRYQDAGKMGYDVEYFMYHKGYGPTIVTLEKYMRQLFPQLYVAPLEKHDRVHHAPAPGSPEFAEAPTLIDPKLPPKK